MGGSSCIKRLKCIGVQGTWYGHFKLSLSQLKGLAKTLGSFNPIWTGLFWLNLGTLEILKFSFFIKELSTLAYRCTHSRIKQTCLCGVGSDAFLGHSQCTNLTYLIFSTFHFVAVVFCCSFCQDIEILFNANSLLLLVIIINDSIIFTSLKYIKSRLSLHLCTNLNHDIFMQEN